MPDRGAKILVLTKYGRLGASSRLRFMQYFNYLEESGLRLYHHPLIDNESLSTKYLGKQYSYKKFFKNYIRRFQLLVRSNQYDLLWIQAECFPYVPFFIEYLFLKNAHFVLDYDDAIFHNYDINRNIFIRFFLGKKIARLMRRADLVVTGNQYLKEYAVSSGCGNVAILPTVVDHERYSRPTCSTDKLIIGWVGSPSTVKYLDLVSHSLIRLKKVLDFELWVIGAQFENKQFTVINLPWSEETEVDMISKFDIGIMPLFDTPWERGKCGYKLIQYMAVGVPVVGSGVGVNKPLIENANSGFVASNENEWYQALYKLAKSKRYRRILGKNGKLAVRLNYSQESTKQELLKFLNTSTNNIESTIDN